MTTRESRSITAAAGAVSPLPQAADEVDAAWLNRVLHESGAIDGETIESIEAHHLPEGFGAQCTYARFHLRYAGPDPDGPEPRGPEWVFAKFSRNAPNAKVIGQREVRFYHEIAPSITLPIPQCHFAGYDESDGRSIIVLEDVSAGVAGDSLAGCSTETAEALLREVASFHASWWNHPQLSAWDWIRPGKVPSGILDRMRLSWPQFKTTFADVLTPASLEAGDLAMKKLSLVWEGVTSGPVTLVHGDLQLDNVRLDVGESPFVLLDWQLVRCINGAHDLAWFLARSLPVDQRRADGEHLIHVYYQSLIDAGMKHFSMDDLMSHLNLRLLFDLFIVATASVHANFSSDRGSRLLKAFVQRNVAMIDDYESWEVLR